MVALSLEVPQADVDALNGYISQLQTECHMLPKDACRVGAIAVLKSLRPSTKIAAKLRPIVRNPDKRAGKDGRVATFGVYKWDDHDNKYFQPILRTGEFGKIRFKSKTTAEWLVRDKLTGEVHRQQWETGAGEFQIAGIAQNWKRKIGNRGTAQDSWVWAMQKLFNTGPATRNKEPTRTAVHVKKSQVDLFNYSVTIDNVLDYITAAMKGGGRLAVSTAMSRAANVMKGRIAQRLKGVIK